MSIFAVVVAAGSGTRLGGDQTKALRELAGIPLVVHSVRALATGGVTSVVVVVPAAHQSDFDEVLQSVDIAWRTVPGGAERQESVSIGLAALDPAISTSESIVLVHDAARPLVPAAVVTRVIDAVRDGSPAVIPVVPVIDTIRQIDGADSDVIDRSTLRAVQTPQGFNLGVLRAAHQAAADADFQATDDAAVCERAGHHVTLVAGSSSSFKITQPLDLALAETAILRETVSIPGT